MSMKKEKMLLEKEREIVEIEHSLKVEAVEEIKSIVSRIKDRTEAYRQIAEIINTQKPLLDDLDQKWHYYKSQHDGQVCG